jgi:hypothetical protein
VLKESVKGIKPMKMVHGRREVGGLIERPAAERMLLPVGCSS